MKKLFLTILMLFYFSSCGAWALRMPKVKPQKLHDMQECIYQTDNIELVLSSVIGTLQDSDFIIEEINPEFGFVRAQKVFKAHYVNAKRVAGWSAALAAATAYTVFSYGSTAASMYSPSRRVATEMKNKTVVVDTNIFVENIGDNQVRVKFIPVAKILQNADGFSFFTSHPVRVLRIYRPKIYREFFAQVGQNLD